MEHHFVLEKNNIKSIKTSRVGAISLSPLHKCAVNLEIPNFGREIKQDCALSDIKWVMQTVPVFVTKNGWIIEHWPIKSFALLISSEGCSSARIQLGLCHIQKSAGRRSLVLWQNVQAMCVDGCRVKSPKPQKGYCAALKPQKFPYCIVLGLPDFLRRQQQLFGNIWMARNASFFRNVMICDAGALTYQISWRLNTVDSKLSYYGRHAYDKKKYLVSIISKQTNVMGNFVYGSDTCKHSRKITWDLPQL